MTTLHFLLLVRKPTTLVRKPTTLVRKPTTLVRKPTTLLMMATTVARRLRIWLPSLRLPLLAKPVMRPLQRMQAMPLPHLKQGLALVRV
jgi:hypothetical protein